MYVNHSTDLRLLLGHPVDQKDIIKKLLKLISEQYETNKYAKSGENVCNILELQFFNTGRRHYTGQICLNKRWCKK